jgi:hypothetical protein
MGRHDASFRRRGVGGSLDDGRHPNVVVVALTAKLARIDWAVLRNGADYDRCATRA